VRNRRKGLILKRQEDRGYKKQKYGDRPRFHRSHRSFIHFIVIAVRRFSIHREAIGVEPHFPRSKSPSHPSSEDRHIVTLSRHST